ncbi:MAG: radical SAM protein [Nitrososphaeria archaeon]
MASSLLNCPSVRESVFYEKLGGGRVKCSLCERRCVIDEGCRGFCGTRVNVGGKLYTLVYGDISALESRPIEIKPFYHYWPNSTALTFSTWSCNFICPWCQNFHLSRTLPSPEKAYYLDAGKVVEVALKYGDCGVCASFQEPTLLTEWAGDVFSRASQLGLYCCYVSNGYLTLEALHFLKNCGLDGLKVDVKGDVDTYRKYLGGLDVEIVWRNIREAKRLGIHVEVVNLIVTGVNDSEDCIRWIVERHVKEAGPDTPLHFTRYFPAYKFTSPPTKVEVLEMAYMFAKRVGIWYPYVGNVLGHKFNHTYCHNCGEKVIVRSGYNILDYRLIEENVCPKCGTRIPIKGKYVRR